MSFYSGWQWVSIIILVNTHGFNLSEVQSRTVVFGLVLGKNKTMSEI